MENHTAKHFALQLGSLASLYISLSFLLVLLFGIINLLFPDATEGIYQIEAASSGVRTGIAFVLIFFPTYILLTRLVNKNRRDSKDSNYLGLTKWLIYLSLLVGGGVILGDLVAIVMMFLEGEITQRFIFKALAVFLVIGAAVHYYILDARGHWLQRESQSIMFGIGTIIFVAVALAYGFANIEAPAAVREQKLDDKQVQDLQNIQWKMQDYLLTNETLPETINELFKNTPVPTAPEGRSDYRYQKTEQGFELCATFSHVSEQTNYYFYDKPVNVTGDTRTIINPDDWSHGTGEVCFERVVK